MRVGARVAAAVLAALCVGAMTTGPAAASWHFETLDGGGGAAGRIDKDVGNYTSSILYAGTAHTFYRNAEDGTLRHGWWTGKRWVFETLDGRGGGAGRISDDVGTDVEAILLHGTPHVFYYDVTNGDLRHGWWTGATWLFETLDGSGGRNGRINADVGTDLSVTVFASTPHTWYYDVTNGDLRHGWWTGTTWLFETLDGAAGARGRVSADVGRYLAVTIYRALPHVFYYDDTNTTLRHGWWTGATWAFEILDGTSRAGGRVNESVGSDVSVKMYAGTPHVWYYGIDNGNLRHGWWTGAAWAFETLDGAGGGGARLDADLGMYTSVVIFAGTPHVFYRDNTNQSLRHAWWTGAAWRFETLDRGDVGLDGSAVVFGSQLDVLYYKGSGGNLRHAWYT